MALSDRKEQMDMCLRCSACKWVVLSRIKSKRFSVGCPSIQYGKFHAYSGGGKVITANGLFTGRIGYTDEMVKTVHACSMCGACDISCKFNMADTVEPLGTIRELRVKMVEDGQIDPAHMVMIDGLKREDNVFGKPKADRAKWAEGLNVPDIFEKKAEVYLHVGCHFAYDEELWPVIRGAVRLLQEAGVDLGIAKKDEACCGGRAYEAGYKGEFENYAEDLVGRVKASGAKMLLTCCSDGYGTFKQLYPKAGRTFEGVEVLHISEYIASLMKKGKITFTQKVPLRVTYHDPCHLGRLGEPYMPWTGTRKRVLNGLIITDPKKEVMFGVKGIYDPPREILKGIPGVEFVEMERIREYAYCCGAGGGAKEAYPDFALMAARERIEEAKATGADALVTACPWCERNLKDALHETGEKMEIYDIVEIMLKGMGR
jgi:Fe-S oxidoreductase